MANQTGLKFRPRACQRCGGDAYFVQDEDNEWRCLQCGRLVLIAGDTVARTPIAASLDRQAA